MQGDNHEFDEKKRIKQWSIALVISACIIIAIYFCFLRSAKFAAAIDTVVFVFQPLIIGFIMAFLMNPIMGVLERRLVKPIRKISKTDESARKTARNVSTILALIIFIGICALFIWAIIPELIDTIVYLANHIEDQIAGVLDWCNDITKGRYEEALMNAKESKIDYAIEQGVKYVQKYLQYDQDDVVTYVTNYVITISKFLINIIIGMFVSVYVLVSKETFKGQAKKIICGTFKPEHANIILEVSRKSGDIFYGFIIGKIIDSIIIGVICYISCLIMSMPYAVLVSVIIGVTNIIPVFGPYIGAIPTVVIIFLTEPMKGIYFLIFVIILQQIDGNWIGPKILGNSTGISSFWVVFAVVVGGGLFGIPGMVIGVPVMAIIYYLLGRHSKYMLKKRGLPVSTKDYTFLDHIDTETGELIEKQESQAPKKRTAVFPNTSVHKKNKK